MAPRGVESDLLSRRFGDESIVRRQVTRLAVPLDVFARNVSGPFTFKFQRPVYLSIRPTLHSVCASIANSGGNYFLLGIVPKRSLNPIRFSSKPVFEHLGEPLIIHEFH